MSLKDVQAGKYTAKAVEGAWGKSKEKGTPMVAVRFAFDNDGSQEHLWWTGYLTNTVCPSGKTVSENTFETLALLGYNDEKALVNDDNGNPCFTCPEHLEDKEVSITVEVEDYNGKPQHKIKWINALGGSIIAGMPVAQVLGSLNLKAEMAAARARLGAPKPKSTTPAIKPETKTEELPF